jgi:hypothetical protein
MTHSLSHRTETLSSARLLISNAEEMPLTAQRCSLATFDVTPLQYSG